MLKQLRHFAAIILLMNFSIFTAPAQSGRVRSRESNPRPVETPGSNTPSRPLTVPKGTIIELRLDVSLGSKTNNKGDEFTSTVIEPVFVEERMLIAPSAVVKCHIINAQPAARNRNNGSLTIGFDELIVDGKKIDLAATLVSIAARSEEVLDENGEGKIKDPKKKKSAPVTIGTSAGIGATIGAIGGAPGGAIGGGAIGAGVGIGSILLSKGQDIELLSGTILKIRLESDLKLDESTQK
jgi:hypothetical protein